MATIVLLVLSVPQDSRLYTPTWGLVTLVLAPLATLGLGAGPYIIPVMATLLLLGYRSASRSQAAYPATPAKPSSRSIAYAKLALDRAVRQRFEAVALALLVVGLGVEITSVVAIAAAVLCGGRRLLLCAQRLLREKFVFPTPPDSVRRFYALFAGGNRRIACLINSVRDELVRVCGGRCQRKEGRANDAHRHRSVSFSCALRSRSGSLSRSP